MAKRISVTKPYLPPRNEYKALLDDAWERDWLTNNGPFVQQLENELEIYLHVQNLNFVSNGTIALQIAIKILELEGEIITTPFSYVATTSSIVWEGCEPVFADINTETLNIEPSHIEPLITNETTAIMATHVFGNPCDIETIRQIADKHDLKVIYDAAHCFGTKYKGESVYNYGDISTASFHATKLYHTVEGGAVVSNDDEINEKVAKMRNFGHAGPGNFEGVGINGKNSEFHAAMGLCNLKYIEEVLEQRKRQSLLYDSLLENLPIQTISIQEGAEWNYAYYPVIFEDEKLAVQVKDELESNEVYPRRYFYPSLDTLDYVDSKQMKVSKDISERILCLPLFHHLKKKEQERICSIVQESIKADEYV